MEGWREMKFGDVVLFPPKIKMIKGKFYPFIPMENLSSGIKYVKPKIEKKLIGGGAKFEEGDTLFARITPCLQNGKIAQAKDLNEKSGFGSTEYFVFRGDTGLTDSDFIYYLSKTHWFQQNAINSMVGSSGRQRADAGFVRSIKINLPPLITQKKIASILSAYDDLIENNLKRIKLLEEKAQQTYTQWFVRLKFPNHQTTPINPKTGLPEGWERVTIGELAEVKGGKRLPKSHNLIENKSTHPYIRVRDLTSGRVSIQNLLYIKNETYQLISKYIINDSDLYISIAGTVGLVGTIPNLLDGANLTENCAKITNIKNLVLKEYICYFLNGQKGKHHIASRTGGASQPKLALTRIRTIPIVIPDTDTLQGFHNITNSINCLIEKIQVQNSFLNEARDLLLPRLMTGMIDVDKLDIQI